ncbi:7tm Odorant receptor [Popillia japonica]|uniref:7tm Odorant receptor n=1 Tax=Popillia japonica TaxID=7064 RepID=A0AAW1MIH1_POPJA
MTKLLDGDILELGVDIFKIIGEHTQFTTKKIYIYRTFNVGVCLFSLYFVIANCFKENGGMLVKTLEGAITIFHVLAKYLAFIHGKPKINSIITDRFKFWNPEDVNQKLGLNANLLCNYTKIVQTFLLCVFITSVHFCWLKPLFNSNDVFPFNVWINSDSLLLNVVVLASQYYCLCLVTPIVLTYDVIYFSICLHVIIQLRLLKYEISKKTSNNIHSELKIWIGHHQLLSSIFTRMQEIYSGVLLLEYLMTLGMTCIQLYILNTVQLHVADTTELILYLATMYTEFGYYSIPIEEISFEFSDVGNAVYKSLWYEKDASTKRSMLFVMMYAQELKYLNGGGLIRVNIDTFASNASWHSYGVHVCGDCAAVFVDCCSVNSHRMPPGTRSGSEKGDDNVIINFLKGAEFADLMRVAIGRAVAKETKTLCDKITQLEIKINGLEMKNTNLCNKCDKLNKNKYNVSYSETTKTKAIDTADVTKKGKCDKLNKNKYNVSYSETTKTKVIDTADVTKKGTDKNISDAGNVQSGTKTNRLPDMEINRPPNTDKNNWKVTTRKRQQLPIVRGSATERTNIKAAKKYAHFHVYRLQPNSSSEDLEAYLKSKKVENVKCLKVTSKRPEEYSSFKPRFHGAICVERFRSFG